MALQPFGHRGNDDKLQKLLRGCFGALNRCFCKTSTRALINPKDFELPSANRMQDGSHGKIDTALLCKQLKPSEATTIHISGVNEATLQDSPLKHEIRDSMVLFVSSSIVTVFSLNDFRVLHQNPSSVWYYGNLQSNGGRQLAMASGQDVLHHIFSLDDCKLKRMLEDVIKGGVGRCWKGVIRVPPAGSFCMGALQVDATAKLEAVAELEVEVRDTPERQDDCMPSHERLSGGGSREGDNDQTDSGVPGTAASSDYAKQMTSKTPEIRMASDNALQGNSGSPASARVDAQVAAVTIASERAPSPRRSMGELSAPSSASGSNHVVRSGPITLGAGIRDLEGLPIPPPSDAAAAAHASPVHATGAGGIDTDSGGGSGEPRIQQQHQAAVITLRGINALKQPELRGEAQLYDLLKIRNFKRQGAWEQEQAVHAYTGTRNHEGPADWDPTGRLKKHGCKDNGQEAVAVELSGSVPTIAAAAPATQDGGGRGGVGSQEQRRRRLTSLNALGFHPHRGGSETSIQDPRKRSISGHGSSGGRALPFAQAVPGGGGSSGGGGGGGSGTGDEDIDRGSGTGNAAPARQIVTTAAGIAISLGTPTHVSPFASSRPSSGASTSTAGFSCLGASISAFESRFNRLSRHKVAAKDLLSLRNGIPGDRASSPCVGAAKKGMRINSPRALQYLLPLGLVTHSSSAGSVDGATATATAAANSTTGRKIGKRSPMDMEEHVDELPERCLTAPRPNSAFLVPLDGQGRFSGGRGRVSSMQLRVDETHMRGGLSGNASLSMSGAQLLMDMGPGSGQGSNLLRRMLTGPLQPVSQVVQHNDPLATSTFSLSLGPLHLPLVAPLNSTAGTSCSSRAFQPTSVTGPVHVTRRGMDLHTHPTISVSTSLFAAGGPLARAYGSISAANHPTLNSYAALAATPPYMSSCSSTASHTPAKATQSRGAGAVGGLLRGYSGLGDSSFRQPLDTTAGINTISALSGLTVPLNTSTSLLGCLSSNLDRQRDASPQQRQLQPRTRPPAPVVPQPARTRVHIQSWANGDCVINPGAPGSLFALQQPSASLIEQVQQQQQEQRATGPHQPQQSQTGIMFCAQGSQTQELKPAVYSHRGPADADWELAAKWRSAEQDGMGPASATPSLPALRAVPMAPLSGPPPAPSTPDTTIAPISGAVNGAHPGIQDPGAGIRQRETSKANGEGLVSSFTPNTAHASTPISASPVDATRAHLSPSGGSRGSISGIQGIEAAAVKATDVLLPTLRSYGQEGPAPGAGDGAALASVNSTPLSGPDTGPTYCATPLGVDSTPERSSGCQKRGNTSGGLVGGGGGTTAAGATWYRSSTLGRDTAGVAAASAAAGSVLQLLSGLGSGDAEPVYGRDLCSGFFTVDGAQREGCAQQESYLERISEAASFARDLRTTSSFGTKLLTPLSLARGVGSLKGSSAAGTQTDSKAAAPDGRRHLASSAGSMPTRLSLDNRHGLMNTYGMPGRPSLDCRRNLFSIGPSAQRPSFDARRGLMGRASAMATSTFGETTIGLTATATGSSSFRMNGGLAGLSASGLDLGSGDVDVEVNGGGSGGKCEGTYYGASKVLSSPEDVTAPAAAAEVAMVDTVEEHWHEVWATRAVDPVTGEDVVILTQHDVSAKVVAERQVALMMETEHRLLEELFPRHILQHITEEWTKKMAALAATAKPVMPGAGANGTGGVGGGGGGAGRKVAHNSLPASFRLQPLATDCSSLATWHEQVTLLFADIKGFTPMCKEVQPFQVMRTLNDLFSRWDALLGAFGVHKVETIGDCYFVAGGLFCYDADGMVAVRDRCSRNQQPDPHHARRVFEFAKAMVKAANAVPLPTSGEPVQIRVGIHSGPVVSGVVGTRMPRFCLFGDTVNTASRLETTGVEGGIHVSDTTRQLLLRDGQDNGDGTVVAAATNSLTTGGGWTATGGIEVKGKGLMKTWLWRASS